MLDPISKLASQGGHMIDSAPSPIETKIIEATIACIEQYGIQGTTNRKIAELAGVNSAAINYYFRSKDALIQRVMQVTLHNAFDLEDIPQQPGDSAAERCKAIFNHLIAGGAGFPGLTRAHFYDLLTEGDYDSLAVKKINEFMQQLAEDLRARGAALDPDELRLACAQIAAAALMMILAPRLFADKLGIDMTDEATRRQFIDRLVEHLLAGGQEL
jgi:AcrR family transcriptional regulator